MKCLLKIVSELLFLYAEDRIGLVSSRAQLIGRYYGRTPERKGGHWGTVHTYTCRCNTKAVLHPGSSGSLRATLIYNNNICVRSGGEQLVPFVSQQREKLKSNPGDG